MKNEETNASEELFDYPLERSVIIGALRSSDTFLDIDPILNTDTFGDSVHQALWSITSAIYHEDNNARMDTSLIRAKAQELNLAHIIENKKEIKYISDLFSVIVEPSNVRKFAAKIRILEIARLLNSQLELAQGDVVGGARTSSVDQLVAFAENRIFDFSSLISTERNSGYVHISEGSLEYYEYLTENPRDLLGISSGFPIYDQLLGGGLQRKCVNMIGARTNVGKSFLADNIALHVAGKLNIPVLYLDTEMDMQGHWFRIWANVSKVPSNLIKTGKAGKNEVTDAKVREAIQHVDTIPYYYSNISGKPFEEVLAYIRRWLVREVGYDSNGNIKDCLIVHDYLKLMTAEGISNDMKEYQILGFQMTSLHNFAVKYDVPILSFIQLNRDGITKDGLEAISQSDRVSWLASSVSIYKRKSDEEIADTSDRGNMKFIVVKSRHGQTNNYNEYINYNFNGSIGLITEGNLSTDPTPIVRQENPNQSFEIEDSETNGELISFAEV